MPCPALCPGVRRIVTAGVTGQWASVRSVDDDADVAADTNGPEILVLRPVELVKLHARIGRIHLEVERRGLRSRLLVALELGEAVCEIIGNAEVHYNLLCSVPLAWLGASIVTAGVPAFPDNEIRPLFFPAPSNV